MIPWLLWLRVMQSFCMVIATGLVVCCSIAIAQDRQQLQEIWGEKVPEETKRFFDFLKSRKTKACTYSVVNKLLVNGKLQSFDSRQALRRKGSFWLFSRDADKPMNSLEKQCCGFNSKYAFMLKRSKKSKDWVIHNITEVTPGLDEQNLFNIGVKTANGDEGFRAAVNAMFDSFDQDIVSVLLFSGIRAGKTSDNNSVECADRRSRVEPWRIPEIPGFRLRSISAEGARQNILRVDFDYEAMNAEQKKIGIVHCQMDFDIELKCHPCHSHQVLKNGTEETILDWSQDLKQTKENEYEQKSIIQLKRKSNSVDTLLEETKVEIVFSLDDPPEREFTLSAFGLPEPPGIEWKKPFPWYLVFAGIGTTCLGVFFFLRARAKRLKVA